VTESGSYLTYVVHFKLHFVYHTALSSVYNLSLKRSFLAGLSVGVHFYECNLQFSQPDLPGYVGFANLPNQVHRKSVKKGFEFTLMIVGGLVFLLLSVHLLWYIHDVHFKFGI